MSSEKSIKAKFAEFFLDEVQLQILHRSALRGPRIASEGLCARSRRSGFLLSGPLL
jgi:hypothetical protein